MSGIPTLALSKSGYRSEVIPPSQPVIQAPAIQLYYFYKQKEATDLAASEFLCFFDITQYIPTLALSKSGSRSKVIPSSQPVTQAPVSYCFIHYNIFCMI